jgi:signal transduction histidine kinase
VAFVIASLIEVNGAEYQIFTIVYSVFFLFILFSIERGTRMTFFESKRASLAELEKIELMSQRKNTLLANEKKNHQHTIDSMQAEEEKRLIEREREQLTSLIGNVAHDLKTPLQSIKMDLELLERILKEHESIKSLRKISNDHRLLAGMSATGEPVAGGSPAGKSVVSAGRSAGGSAGGSCKDSPRIATFPEVKRDTKLRHSLTGASLIRIMAEEKLMVEGES